MFYTYILFIFKKHFYYSNNKISQWRSLTQHSLRLHTKEPVCTQFKTGITLGSLSPSAQAGVRLHEVSWVPALSAQPSKEISKQGEMQIKTWGTQRQDRIVSSKQTIQKMASLHKNSYIYQYILYHLTATSSLNSIKKGNNQEKLYCSFIRGTHLSPFLSPISTSRESLHAKRETQFLLRLVFSSHEYGNSFAFGDAKKASLCSGVPTPWSVASAKGWGNQQKAKSTIFQEGEMQEFVQREGTRSCISPCISTASLRVLIQIQAHSFLLNNNIKSHFLKLLESKLKNKSFYTSHFSELESMLKYKQSTMSRGASRSISTRWVPQPSAPVLGTPSKAQVEVPQLLRSCGEATYLISPTHWFKKKLNGRIFFPYRKSFLCYWLLPFVGFVSNLTPLENFAYSSFNLVPNSTYDTLGWVPLSRSDSRRRESGYPSTRAMPKAQAQQKANIKKVIYYIPNLRERVFLGSPDLDMACILSQRDERCFGFLFLGSQGTTLSLHSGYLDTTRNPATMPRKETFNFQDPFSLSITLRDHKKVAYQIKQEIGKEVKIYCQYYLNSLKTYLNNIGLKEFYEVKPSTLVHPIRFTGVPQPWVPQASPKALRSPFSNLTSKIKWSFCWYPTSSLMSTNGVLEHNESLLINRFGEEGDKRRENWVSSIWTPTNVFFNKSNKPLKMALFAESFYESFIASNTYYHPRHYDVFRGKGGEEVWGIHEGCAARSAESEGTPAKGESKAHQTSVCQAKFSSIPPFYHTSSNSPILSLSKASSLLDTFYQKVQLGQSSSVATGYPSHWSHTSGVPQPKAKVFTEGELQPLREPKAKMWFPRYQNEKIQEATFEKFLAYNNFIEKKLFSSSLSTLGKLASSAYPITSGSTNPPNMVAWQRSSPLGLCLAFAEGYPFREATAAGEQKAYGNQSKVSNGEIKVGTVATPQYPDQGTEPRYGTQKNTGIFSCEDVLKKIPKNKLYFLLLKAFNSNLNEFSTLHRSSPPLGFDRCGFALPVLFRQRLSLGYPRSEALAKQGYPAQAQKAGVPNPSKAQEATPKSKAQTTINVLNLTHPLLTSFNYLKENITYNNKSSYSLFTTTYTESREGRDSWALPQEHSSSVRYASLPDRRLFGALAKQGYPAQAQKANPSLGVLGTPEVAGYPTKASLRSPKATPLATPKAGLPRGTQRKEKNERISKTNNTRLNYSTYLEIYASKVKQFLIQSHLSKKKILGFYVQGDPVSLTSSKRSNPCVGYSSVFQPLISAETPLTNIDLTDTKSKNKLISLPTKFKRNMVLNRSTHVSKIEKLLRAYFSIKASFYSERSAMRNGPYGNDMRLFEWSRIRKGLRISSPRSISAYITPSSLSFVSHISRDLPHLAPTTTLVGYPHNRLVAKHTLPEHLLTSAFGTLLQTKAHQKKRSVAPVTTLLGTGRYAYLPPLLSLFEHMRVKDSFVKKVLNKSLISKRTQKLSPNYLIKNQSLPQAFLDNSGLVQSELGGLHLWGTHAFGARSAETRWFHQATTDNEEKKNVEKNGRKQDKEKTTEIQLRKYNKKKRRIKKLKKETRHRKKRKRFYPRPIWIRYNIYSNFLKRRYFKPLPGVPQPSVTPLWGTTSSFGPTLWGLTPALHYVKAFGKTALRYAVPFAVGEGEGVGTPSRSEVQVQVHQKKRQDGTQKGNHKIKAQQIKDISMSFYARDTKNFFRVSNTVINDFKRLLWKSYWLRSNFYPYLKKIKESLNYIKQSTQLWEFYFTLQSFSKELGGFNERVNSVTELSRFLSLGLGTPDFCAFSAALHRRCSAAPLLRTPTATAGFAFGAPSASLRESLWRNSTSLRCAGVPRPSEGYAQKPKNQSERSTSKWQKALSFSQYSSITYQRIQQFISQIRENFTNITGVLGDPSSRFLDFSGQRETQALPGVSKQTTMCQGTQPHRTQGEGELPSLRNIKVRTQATKSLKMSKDMGTLQSFSERSQGTSGFALLRDMGTPEASRHPALFEKVKSNGRDSRHAPDFWMNLGKTIGRLSLMTPFYSFTSFSTSKGNLWGKSSMVDTALASGVPSYFMDKAFLNFASNSFHVKGTQTSTPNYKRKSLYLEPFIRMCWAFSKTFSSSMIESNKRAEVWNNEKERSQTKNNKTKKFLKNFSKKWYTFFNEQYELCNLDFVQIKARKLDINIQSQDGDRLGFLCRSANPWLGLGTTSSSSAATGSEAYRTLTVPSPVLGTPEAHKYERIFNKTRLKEEKLKFYIGSASRGIHSLHKLKKQIQKNILINNQDIFARTPLGVSLAYPHLTSSRFGTCAMERISLLGFPFATGEYDVVPNTASKGSKLKSEATTMQFHKVKRSLLKERVPLTYYLSTIQEGTHYTIDRVGEISEALKHNNLTKKSSYWWSLSEGKGSTLDFGFKHELHKKLKNREKFDEGVLSLSTFAWFFGFHGTEPRHTCLGLEKDKTIISVFLFHFCSFISLISLAQIRTLFKFYYLVFSKLFDFSSFLIRFSFFGVQALQSHLVSLAYSFSLFNKGRQDLLNKGSRTMLFSIKGREERHREMQELGTMGWVPLGLAPLCGALPSKAGLPNTGAEDAGVHKVKANLPYSAKKPRYARELFLKNFYYYKKSLVLQNKQEICYLMRKRFNKSFRLEKGYRERVIGFAFNAWGTQGEGAKQLGYSYHTPSQKAQAKGLAEGASFAFGSEATKGWVTQAWTLFFVLKNLRFLFYCFYYISFGITKNVIFLFKETTGFVFGLLPRSLYTFFEKPGELIVDWIAYTFLVEWASDLTNLIPENVDVLFSNSSLKMLRILNSVAFLTNLATLFSFVNYFQIQSKCILSGSVLGSFVSNASPLVEQFTSQFVLSEQSTKLGIPFNFYPVLRNQSVASASLDIPALPLQSLASVPVRINEISKPTNTRYVESTQATVFEFNFLNFPFLNIGSLFLQRRLYHLYEIFIMQFFQPDMDIIIRHKKGIIFWDIWGDFLMQVAENSNINISELTSLKEEQFKLLESGAEALFEPKLSLVPIFNKSRMPEISFIRKQKIKEDVLSLDKNGFRNFLPENLLTVIFGTKGLALRNMPLGWVPQPSPKATAGLGTPAQHSKQRYQMKERHANISSARCWGTPVQGLLGTQTLMATSLLGQTSSIFTFGEVSQFLSYQGKDTELFIDLYPPNSFTRLHFLKNNESLQPTVGSLVCQVHAGLLLKQVSKNVLVVSSGYPNAGSVRGTANATTSSGSVSNTTHTSRLSIAKTLLIQAIAGETELKIITDNAYRYSLVYRGVAVGIKLLKEVFDSLALHTPCLFLMEDIHAIGARRPLLISDDDTLKATEGSIIGSQREEIHEKNQVLYQLSKHMITHYKKPYKGDFSLLIPTNHFCFDILRSNVFSSTSLNSPYIQTKDNNNDQGMCEVQSGEGTKKRHSFATVNGFQNKSVFPIISSQTMSNQASSFSPRGCAEGAQKTKGVLGWVPLGWGQGTPAKPKAHKKRSSPGPGLESRTFSSDSVLGTPTRISNLFARRNKLRYPEQGYGSVPFAFGDAWGTQGEDNVGTPEVSGYPSPSWGTQQKATPIEYQYSYRQDYDKKEVHSRLQMKSSELLAPPATSPFSVLTLKEEKKFQTLKDVIEMPWSSLPGEQLAQVLKSSYSIRVKVALLADAAMSSLSVKLDMITDLLVIIDSVKGNRGFVVFATTHIPFVLDPALRRPGRLDETIILDTTRLPSVTFSPKAKQVASRIEGAAAFCEERYKVSKHEMNSWGTHEMSAHLSNLVISQSSQVYSTRNVNNIPSFRWEILNSYFKLFKGCLIKQPSQETCWAFRFSSGYGENLAVQPNFSTFNLKKLAICKSHSRKLLSLAYFRASNIFYNNFASSCLLSRDVCGLFGVVRATPNYRSEAMMWYPSQKKRTTSIGVNTTCYYTKPSEAFLSFYSGSPMSHASLVKNYINSLISGKLGEMFFIHDETIKSNILLSYKAKNSESFFNIPLFNFLAVVQNVPFNKTGIPNPAMLHANSVSLGTQGFATGAMRQCGTPEQSRKKQLMINKVPKLSVVSSTRLALCTQLTSLILSFIQKRYIYHQNLIVPEFLYFVNKSSFFEPLSPPTSNILLPARRYENYRRSFAYYYLSSPFMKRTLQKSDNIIEKISLHQQQRLVKRLYRYPVKETFKSEFSHFKNTSSFSDSFGFSIDSRHGGFAPSPWVRPHFVGPNDDVVPQVSGVPTKAQSKQLGYLESETKNLTSFSNANLMIGSLSASLNFNNNTNKVFRHRILLRHRNYLTNQWWNGQLPEHNAETTFLSDIDWRYTFMESVGDLLLDFPDADQHYNPQNRRWLLTKGSFNYWFDFEKRIYSEFYSHFIFDCFLNIFHIYEKHRDILDYYVYYVLNKGQDNKATSLKNQQLIAAGEEIENIYLSLRFNSFN